MSRIHEETSKPPKVRGEGEIKDVFESLTAERIVQVKADCGYINQILVVYLSVCW